MVRLSEVMQVHIMYILAINFVHVDLLRKIIGYKNYDTRYKSETVTINFSLQLSIKAKI